MSIFQVLTESNPVKMPFLLCHKIIILDRNKPINIVIPDYDVMVVSCM